METSQVECIAFISGYAVFSYIKKSNGYLLCRNFLTTNTSIQLNNDMDIQFRLIEFVDRGSLKYPSTSVIESAKVIFDIFSKIDCNKKQFEIFYSGFPRTKLIQLACATMEIEHSEIWRVWCECNTSRWDILRKLFLTISNCLLSNKVKTYNSLVLRHDNSKLTKLRTNLSFFVLYTSSNDHKSSCQLYFMSQMPKLS